MQWLLLTAARIYLIPVTPIIYSSIRQRILGRVREGVFMSATSLRWAGSCRCRFVVLPLMVSCFPLASYAQVLYGSLTGSVTDATDAGIAAAKVEATNTNTGVARQTTTDGRGVYLFSDLQPGTYAITISAPSFGAISQQGLAGNPSTAQPLHARLPL